MKYDHIIYLCVTNASCDYRKPAFGSRIAVSAFTAGGEKEPGRPDHLEDGIQL